MHIGLLSALISLPLHTAAAKSPDVTPARDAVLVIGALHNLHAKEPSFDYAKLRAAILAFKPDVLALEVRPDELAARKPTPGRPEYPAVVWPLLSQLTVTAVAMEPGGETFTAISGQAGAAYGDFSRRDPEGAAALSKLQVAADEALLAYWRKPGQAQDDTTASLTAGVQAAQFALAGDSFAAAQRRWDGYMADRARQAVRANPGKRVLVLGSYRNWTLLERAVRAESPERSLDAAAWFDKQEAK